MVLTPRRAAVGRRVYNMPVTIKGGNSGNRENALPPVPSEDGEYSYGTSPPRIVGEVVMKGGTSGNREDALPRIDVAFNRQVPQDTSGSTSRGMGSEVSVGVRVPLYSPNQKHLGDEHPLIPTRGRPDDSAV